MPEERADLVDALPPGVEPRFVTLSVTYEEALNRARSDETRGVSRDPAFLSAHYEATARAVRKAPSTDLLLDTGSIGVAKAALMVSDWAAHPHKHDRRPY
jgi:hypothetical protein